MPIKSKIRTVPNYPKKGIMFRDITTLIKDPVGLRLVIDNLTQRYSNVKYDFNTVVGIESRGFIIGSALAYTLEKGFIPIRKKGKLPAEVVQSAIKQAPRTYVMGARSSAYDLKLDGTRTYLATDGCGVETIDFVTRQRRPPTASTRSTRARARRRSRHSRRSSSSVSTRRIHSGSREKP